MFETTVVLALLALQSVYLCVSIVNTGHFVKVKFHGSSFLATSS